MSGSSVVPKHKINNISANNEAMLVKLGTIIIHHHYCAYFDLAMATLGSRSPSCRRTIPIFNLFQASATLKTFIGRSSAMGTL